MSTLIEIQDAAKEVLNGIMENPGRTTDPDTGKQLIEYWLPEKLAKYLIAEHKRPDMEKTNIAVVKYFTPSGSGTWWASEYDPEYRVFFGKAEILFKEYGSFSLEELRNTKTPPFGLYIERDYYFTPRPLEEC